MLKIVKIYTSLTEIPKRMTWLVPAICFCNLHFSVYKFRYDKWIKRLP